MSDSVRAAVSRAWPIPSTVVDAWAEFQGSHALNCDRFTVEPNHMPHVWVEARGYVIEGVLNELPAGTLDDLRARATWLDYQANEEVAQDAIEHRALTAMLRADIERLARGLGEPG